MEQADNIDEMAEKQQDSVDPASVELANSRVHYMYRDANNYKTSQTVILNGVLTPDQIRAIRTKLDEDQYFIPQQVGLPNLQKHWGTIDLDADHVWHEWFNPDVVAAEPDDPDFTAQQLYDAFMAIKEWDIVRYSADIGLI